MSEQVPTGEGTWMPHEMTVPKEPVDDTDAPQPVRDEEAFLDAVVSHIDDDRSDLEVLRDKVSQWYDSSDGKTTSDPHPPLRLGQRRDGDSDLTETEGTDQEA